MAKQLGIGDMVHFVYGAQIVPAIVTAPALQVNDAATRSIVERTGLTVFPVSLPPFATVAEEGAAGDDGTWPTATWHWPETTPTEEPEKSKTAKKE